MAKSITETFESRAAADAVLRIRMTWLSWADDTGWIIAAMTAIIALGSGLDREDRY